MLLDTSGGSTHVRITDLQAAGCETEVTIQQADVSFQADSQLVSSGSSKVDGVLHAAGVLRDAVLHKQTASSFRAVLAGKVRVGSYFCLNFFFSIVTQTPSVLPRNDSAIL